MSKENSSEVMRQNVQLIDQLFEAAKSEDWDLVDTKIVPDLKKIPNANDLVDSLLNRVNDEDANIRDAVATGLVALNITDNTLLSKSIDQMIIMATTDESKFPAGRAVVFLKNTIRKISLEDRFFGTNNEFKDKLDSAIGKFNYRVDQLGWRDELLENIPQSLN